jgi:hypothetical protein
MFSGCAGSGVLDVTFLAPTKNADGTPLKDLHSFRVYYGTTEQVCGSGRAIVAAAPKVQLPPDQPLTVRLTGLTVGTLYYVTVSAVNAQGIEGVCTDTKSARARPAGQR